MSRHAVQRIRIAATPNGMLRVVCHRTLSPGLSYLSGPRLLSVAVLGLQPIMSEFARHLALLAPLASFVLSFDLIP